MKVGAAMQRYGRNLYMFILSLCGFVLALSARWAFNYFGLSCFEQIIFHLKVPIEGTNTQFIGDWVRKCFLKALVISLVLRVPNFWEPYAQYYGTVCLCGFIGCIVYGLVRIGLPEYILNQFRTTDLYEKYYVDGKNVEITFPEKKRNLILIYAESLETTYTSKENGGNYDEDLLKELTDLAKENLNFSHQDTLGGAHVVAGTGWTTGGLVAQSSGLPLCIPFRSGSFSEDTPFLPGAYTLGDILQKEGYEQELLIGSEAVFGGRKFYYDKHGCYTIFDLNEARRQGKIPEDYREFWGYEDEKLFEFAKEEITRLSQTGNPFNFTMLTVDTHHPYGYADRSYQEEYPERLSNIVRGSSRKIGAFVEWLKQQPFYEDTTVVISGDHLSMAAEYIEGTYDQSYDRTIFNTFLNSAACATRKQNRVFTGFDMYPTILNAMGVKVEGDRLGLGVSLFSEQKTVAEELGLRQLDEAIRKQSRFFKEHILR